jgi:hypothetical protein
MMSVAGALGMVAASALTLAALALPADERGAATLVVSGHVVWGLTCCVVSPTRGVVGRGGRVVVLATLAVAGLVELAAMGWMLAERERAQALWFGLAGSFTLVGIVGTIRTEPEDDVFAGQIFFHLIMALPALGILLHEGLRWRLGGDAAGAGGVLRQVLRIESVALPLVCVALLASLAYGVSRGRRHRDPAWIFLQVHQAAYVTLLARWAYDGL